MIGFFMGRFRVVFIQDFDLAREIASDEAFNNRLDHTYLSDMRGYEGRRIGVISTEGDGWRAHRRFALSTLKEFGFGKKSMSSLISFEATELADRMAEEYAEKDFTVDQTFNIPIFNILWQIVAGKRYNVVTF